VAADGAEREEFERFYLDYRSALLSAALFYVGDVDEAADLAQETFARAWQHWDKLMHHPNRQAWCRAVLRNLATSRWRRRRLEQKRRYSSKTAEVALPPNADHLDLGRLIVRLPDKQRQALLLRALFDLSVDEIAREMKAPAGSVRTWLYRARSSISSQPPTDIPPIEIKDGQP
jgi:RNA polymerase sigma-70 factor, ECF subfamily